MREKLFYSEIDNKLVLVLNKIQVFLQFVLYEEIFFHLLCVTQGKLFGVYVRYFSYKICFFKDISRLALDFIMLSL